jgi:hypothetical protein
MREGILIFLSMICFLVCISSFFFATGWDTGIMAGTIIGYDTNMFGTKKVFVLEDRTIFNSEQGMSQSQIKLCSDAEDIDIHNQIESSINKKVIIEYKERRVGLYGFSVCHEAPITKIYVYNSTK